MVGEEYNDCLSIIDFSLSRDGSCPFHWASRAYAAAPVHSGLSTLQVPRSGIPRCRGLHNNDIGFVRGSKTA